ncbi:MAG TPA: MFS transporter [Asanoa sp.]
MPTPPRPSQRWQRRITRALIFAQLLGAVGLAAGGTAGALLAQDLTGSAKAAGMPLAALVLGSGIGAVAVTRLMDRAGRRVGLCAAYVGGALGAATAVAAAGLRNWSLLLVGSLLLGCGNAAVMLARYAAADVAARPARAISTVVAAASVGAVAGPNLLGPSGGMARILGLPEPAGLFLLAMPAFAGAALVLTVLLRPDPLRLATAGLRTDRIGTGTPARRPSGATLAAVFGDPRIRLALVVLAFANLTMVAMMAVAPVHLHDHGAGMGLVGLMVSVHIAAMYLPSPLTGWLADRYGSRAVIHAGAVLLLCAGVSAAMAGPSRIAVMVPLMLLGIGWNAGLIGGSALLREALLAPSSRSHAEGLGELGMGAAAAVGGGGAGPLMATGGFGLLGLVAAVPCLLTIVAVLASAAGQHRVMRPAAAMRTRRPTDLEPNDDRRGFADRLV